VPVRESRNQTTSSRRADGFGLYYDACMGFWTVIAGISGFYD